MWNRLKSVPAWATIFILLLTLTGIALMAPALRPVLANLVQAAIILGAVFLILAAAFGVAIATQIAPLRPVAEISIAGKHFVGVSRSLVGLAAFFGGMIVTWIITLDVALQAQKPSLDVTQILDDLGQLFLSTLPFIAYAYWLWIAIDLMRVRAHGRLIATEQLLRKARDTRQLLALAHPSLRRQLRRLALVPGWAIFVTYYIAPILLVLVGSTLWQLVQRSLL